MRDMYYQIRIRPKLKLEQLNKIISMQVKIMLKYNLTTVLILI